MKDFAGLSGELVAAVNRHGPDGVQDQLNDLIASLWSGGAPSSDVVGRLLKALRANRCFEALLRVTDTLLSVGYDQPPVTSNMAQALIDLGHYTAAEQTLQRSLDGRPHGGRDMVFSETQGLLGRLHKQRFVAAAPHDLRSAAMHLRAALRHYAEAYEVDPIWHGANLVALLWRADRESIEIDGFDTWRAAQKLLTAARAEETWQRRALRTPTPWRHAAIAQAAMATNDWAKAAAHYRLYAEAALRLKDAFMLMGDYRQLREIWQLAPTDEPKRATILSDLARDIASLPGGHLAERARDLRALADLQVLPRAESAPAEADDPRAALSISDDLTPRALLRKLEANTPFVCQIVDHEKHAAEQISGGTGFLVSAGMFKNGRRGVLLATNAHVLSASGGANSVAVARAMAIFHNWNGEDRKRSFPIKRILWSSPPEAHDLCLAEIVDLPAGSGQVRISRQPSHYAVPNRDLDQEIGKAYLIGHPQGRDLEFSLETPGVLDHELHRSPGVVRRVHYRSPTEGGSSGSPVFDGSTAEVIAIHRARTPHQIPESPKEFPPRGYFAREGAGLHAAARDSRRADWPD